MAFFFFIKIAKGLHFKLMVVIVSRFRSKVQACFLLLFFFFIPSSFPTALGTNCTALTLMLLYVIVFEAEGCIAIEYNAEPVQGVWSNHQ